MRRFLFACLILALLLRSAAGLAMQITMAHALMVASATQQALPACHTAMQASTLGASDAAQSSPSDCQLCCSAVALPSDFQLVLSQSIHAAPTVALFSNLPATAQRPSKPPLI